MLLVALGVVSLGYKGPSATVRGTIYWGKIGAVWTGLDALRHGFYSASEDVRPVHPVQQLQTMHRRNQFELKMATVEQVYGKAAAMRLRTEKAVMEQFGRLPGLPSSRIGLDTVTGADEELNFSDFLNDPNEHPEHNFRVHEAMEVKLSIF